MHSQKIIRKAQQQHLRPNMPPLSQESTFALISDDSAHLTETTEEGVVKKSRVSFTTIEVREYERVVGDHPDTKVGPPMSIGWAFNQKEAINLDRYEANRVKKGTRRMSSITRKNILRNVFEIPEEEIRMAEKEVQRIYSKRSKTNSQGKVAEKVEETVQSFGRKMKRTFSKERLWKNLLESQLMFPAMTVH